MANKKGTGLFIVLLDMPANIEEDFNHWYNEEHIPQLLSLPGFLNAARYVAVKGGPKYMACYELESPEVMNTPEYIDSQKNPTEWTKKVGLPGSAARIFASVYQQIFPAEVTPAVASSDLAPAIQMGRMDIDPATEDEFNEWYNTVYIPNYEKVTGCIRGRRYTRVTGLNEQPKYATVYEFEHERVSESPEWATAREADSRSSRIRDKMYHADGSPGVYKKILPV